MTATKGLEGIVATTSSISSIVDGVLTYRGYNIDDLAVNADFEEVAYLLWFGKLPDKEQLQELRNQLSEYAAIPDEIVTQLKLYPKDLSTMAALRSAVSSLALYDPEADDMSRESNVTKTVKLQAQLPTIVAAIARIREGLEPIAPKKGISIAENFLYQLTGKDPEEMAIKAFNQALVLHADHELNASTFAARVTVATLSDIYSGITSAIGALKDHCMAGPMRLWPKRWRRLVVWISWTPISRRNWIIAKKLWALDTESIKTVIRVPSTCTKCPASWGK